MCLWMSSVKLKLNSNIKRTRWSLGFLKKLLQKSWRILFDTNVFELASQVSPNFSISPIILRFTCNCTALRHKYFPGNFLKSPCYFHEFSMLSQTYKISVVWLVENSTKLAVMYSLFQYYTLWLNKKQHSISTAGKRKCIN